MATSWLMNTYDRPSSLAQLREEVHDLGTHRDIQG